MNQHTHTHPHTQTEAHTPLRGLFCHRPFLLIGCSCRLRCHDVTLFDPVQCESTGTEKGSGLKQTGRKRERWEGTGRGGEKESAEWNHTLLQRGRDTGSHTQAATTGIVTVQQGVIIECVCMCVSSPWAVTLLTPACYSIRDRKQIINVIHRLAGSAHWHKVGSAWEGCMCVYVCLFV